MAGPNKKHLLFIRFSYVDRQKRYHDYRNMGFFCESGFVLHKFEDKEPVFYARLVDFRWISLTEGPPAARGNWVRECYIVLPPIRWDYPCLAIHICGVGIPQNAITINETLGVRKVPNHAF